MNSDQDNLREQIEQLKGALAESEKMLDLFLRVSPSATAVFDLHMRYIAYSQRWLTDYNLVGSDLIGRSHYEIFPDIPARWKAIHQHCLSGAIEKCDEDPFPRADGRIDWVRWEIHPWHTGEGTIGGIIIFSEVITHRKQAESHMNHFRTLLNHSNDAIEVLDTETLRFVDMNETECRVLGYSREELLSMSIPDIVPVFNWDRHRKIIQQIDASGNARIESVRRRKDGTTFPVEVSLKLVELEMSYLVCIVSDISGRKKTEKMLERHTRFYAALSQCNQAIVHGSDEVRLFEEICRIAVQFGGMKMAWVGLVDEVAHLVKPVACCGNETAFLNDISISTDLTGTYSVAPTAVAIREDRAYWCQDLFQDEATLPWREIIGRAQWASSASLPLHREGRVIGAFVLYSNEVNAFDELTRNLLVEMAMDISFALDGFDREFRRRQVEEALRESEIRLRQTTEMSNIAIWEYDVETDQMTRSANHDQLYGMPRQEIWRSATFLNATHPDDRERARETVFSALAPGGADTYAFDFMVTQPDDNICWLWVKGTVLKRDSRGNGLLVRGVLIDVTERMQTREALQESQGQLDLALHSAGMGVWSVDLIANQRHFDKRTCQLLGIDPATFTGSAQEFFAAIHPEDRDIVKLSLARTIEQNVPYESDYRALWRDGSIHYITSRGRLEFDAQRRPWKITSIIFEVTEWKEAQKRINSLAFYDSLTELPNRRLLAERIQHALAFSARNGRMGAILFIDLDNFKTINDTLGHSVGDILLQQVATRLNACVREEDTVARIGGDEFVVMLENLSEADSEAATQTQFIAEKILLSLSRSYQIASYKYHCTCSVGVALFNGRQQSIDDLLKQADIAMYQAKKSGRNTLRFFDAQMQEIVTARAALETELRSAIEQHQFQLYYQIQVDQFSRAIGAEALIRWNHPMRGLVSPLEFIPLLEETGMILPVGQWVLDTACAQLKAWEQEEHTRHLVLAVNVSARDFLQTDFVGKVRAIVESHGIAPERLKLELTESLLLESIDDTIAIMNALNQIGIQFSLDDFGTGYSSLQYIKRLPLDQVKIDQSFVRDLVGNRGDQAIVRTIIVMAQSMNLEVIAEGVETEEQFRLLLNKGCTHFQGYLFGKPVPINKFLVTP